MSTANPRLNKPGEKSLKSRALIGLGAIMIVWLVVTMVVGSAILNNQASEQMEDELRNQCHLVMREYDRILPGEYEVRTDENGNYRLYKGGHDVSENAQLLESLHEIMGTDISIFCQDVRLITTLTDKEGVSLAGTAVSAVVTKDVIKTGKPAFYTSVRTDSGECYAYYEPFFSKDGKVFGMVGVAKRADDVKQYINGNMVPTFLVFIFGSLLIAAFAMVFTNSIIRQVGLLEAFMKKVSSGMFTDRMDSEILHRKDELGELARISVSMQKSLREQVELDSLTRLNNRRYGEKRLRSVHSRMENTGETYSVCIGDIDFFKKVNDTYGHENGDTVLQAVSDILRKSMVGKGFAARWGGEEFLMVFENGSFANAVGSLNQTLDEIRALEIPVGEEIIHVTMSMGVAEVTEGESVDRILKRADERLYYGKSHGRNQVVWFEPDPEEPPKRRATDNLPEDDR